MGRHQSTPAAGTAKKEKKAERRCKQRPPGAEPLKAKASSLIYKRSRASRQPHQQGSPGDAPPVPRGTGLCSPPRVRTTGRVPGHFPGGWDHSSWLLPALEPHVEHVHCERDLDTATGRWLAAQRGWRKRDLFASPFVLFVFKALFPWNCSVSEQDRDKDKTQR